MFLSLLLLLLPLHLCIGNGMSHGSGGSRVVKKSRQMIGPKLSFPPLPTQPLLDVLERGDVLLDEFENGVVGVAGKEIGDLGAIILRQFVSELLKVGMV